MADLPMILMLLGAFVMFSGVVGVLRFPDFFTRIHAASLADGLGLILVMAGVALAFGSWAMGAKILLLLVVSLATSAAAAHALARAAYDGPEAQGKQDHMPEASKHG